jgi:hypothetical protein
VTGSSRKFDRSDRAPPHRGFFWALAVSEWLLVLPAAALLLAAALRLLGPREYEPARSSWVIFEWAARHISHPQAGLLFIGLPGVAALASSLALVLAWRRNEALRQDVSAALESLRRHFAVAMLGTGTLVAAATLAAVVAHLIAD